MSAKQSKLAKLNVAQPCSASWQEMTGNEQKRFCSHCNKHVFDFSRMTRQQIEAVTAVHQGNLCARITRREDGSMVMLEPTLPAYAVRRLNSPLLNAAMATALSLNIYATAQSATLLQGQTATQSKDKPKPNEGKSEAGAASSVSGTVVDVLDAVVSDAVVKLLAPSFTPLTTHSAQDGTFQFTGIAPGTYTLVVESPGFKTIVFTDVRALVSTDTPIRVSLEPNLFSTTTGIIISDPATLLKLHQDSELIVIATIGKSKIVKTSDDSQQMQTTLQLSSILKGNANQHTVPFYHWISDEKKEEMKPGDRLLVFLDQRKSDEGKPIDGYEANDWARSIRKLDDDALHVYRQRIEELNSILATETPDETSLIEWMVRCIEEPATRWDGLYELDKRLYSMKSLNAKSSTDDNAKPPHQSIANEVSESGESQPKTKPNNPRTDAEGSESATLTSLLSSEQQARLTHVLLGIDQLSEEDLLLVGVVMDWSEPRLAAYLVAQLQKLIPEAPPLAEKIVALLAEVLDNNTVSEAAQSYSKNIEYHEDEYSTEEDTKSRPASPKPLAAQIAISKRSAQLIAFLTVVNQALHLRDSKNF
ncbi:MAG TPA: carboxypeptidase-like regulatory domain-containing protein [Blastocatellia bacterium]|nr:carboxypeptidase-like regulatory domain-containing protein [Blastocatellia bacterium]